MKNLLIIMSLVILTGCGIKPSSLKSPEESGTDVYPRTYPDPSTDPKPPQQSGY